MKNTKAMLVYASDRKAAQKIMPSRTSSSKEQCYQGGKVWCLDSASSMRWVRHCACGLKLDVCNWNLKIEYYSANSEVFQGYVLKRGVEVKETSKHHLVLAITLPNHWAKQHPAWNIFQLSGQSSNVEHSWFTVLEKKASSKAWQKALHQKKLQLYIVQIGKTSARVWTNRRDSCLLRHQFKAHLSHKHIYDIAVTKHCLHIQA